MLCRNVVWNKIDQNINSFIYKSFIMLFTYPLTYDIYKAMANTC